MCVPVGKADCCQGSKLFLTNHGGAGEGMDRPRGQRSGHGLFLKPCELWPEGPDGESSEDSVSALPVSVSSKRFSTPSTQPSHDPLLRSAQVRRLQLIDMPEVMWGSVWGQVGSRVLAPGNCPGPPFNLRRS